MVDVQKDSFLKKKTKRNSFTISSKNLYVTYPVCPCTPKFALEFFREKFSTITFMCFGTERHQNGELHLHGLIQGTPKFKIYSSSHLDILFEEIIYHGNYQGARDASKVLDYCKKDGDFLEFGSFISNSRKDVELEARKKKNEILLSQPLPMSVNQGHLLVTKYNEAKSSIQSYRNDTIVVPSFEKKECVWISGATGIGKSRIARQILVNPYFKSLNKWWDGYDGQKEILFDDFDRQGEGLGHYLKIWSDDYGGFMIENKGGSIRPHFTKVYVTSNYTISELFTPEKPRPGDDALVSALKRRFRECTVETDVFGDMKLVDL